MKFQDLSQDVLLRVGVSQHLADLLAGLAVERLVRAVSLEGRAGVCTLILRPVINL